jgi:hypothetical protein
LKDKGKRADAAEGQQSQNRKDAGVTRSTIDRDVAANAARIAVLGGIH